MNHVPDAALDRLDALGRAVLRGENLRIAVGLRTDLRLAVAYDGRTGPFRLAFLYDGPAASRIRDHDSYLTTYVDGVDRRLAAWGLTPPPAYRRCEERPTETGEGVGIGVADDPKIDEPSVWDVYHGTVTPAGGSQS